MIRTLATGSDAAAARVAASPSTLIVKSRSGSGCSPARRCETTAISLRALARATPGFKRASTETGSPCHRRAPPWWGSAGFTSCAPPSIRVARERTCNITPTIVTAVTVQPQSLPDDVRPAAEHAPPVLFT